MITQHGYNRHLWQARPYSDSISNGLYRTELICNMALSQLDAKYFLTEDEQAKEQTLTQKSNITAAKTDKLFLIVNRFG